MNHNEAEDFLAHYGKLGMKWGRITSKIAARDAQIKRDRVSTGLNGLGIRNLVGQSTDQKAIRTAKKQLRATPQAQHVRDLKAKYTDNYLSAQRATSKEIAAGILYAAGSMAVSALIAKKLGG